VVVLSAILIVANVEKPADLVDHRVQLFDELFGVADHFLVRVAQIGTADLVAKPTGHF